MEDRIFQDALTKTALPMVRYGILAIFANSAE